MNSPIHLDRFDSTCFFRGRSRLIEMLWYVLDGLFVRSRLPGSAHRRWLLRLFGATVAPNVVIKPGVRVKFPWRLSIGHHTWLGEDAWIDNIDQVEIGDNCCVSQGAYLCTGSHDVSSPTFNLVTKPIIIRNGVWIAARAVVGPGVIVGEGTVLALGSVATRSLDSWSIYRGSPAKLVRPRYLKDPASTQ